MTDEIPADEILAGEAARILNVSRAYLTQALDAFLKPKRISGGVRIYVRARVEQLAAERAAKTKKAV